MYYYKDLIREKVRKKMEKYNKFQKNVEKYKGSMYNLKKKRY